jgi:hypothetical protein
MINGGAIDINREAVLPLALSNLLAMKTNTTAGRSDVIRTDRYRVEKAVDPAIFTHIFNKKKYKGGCILLARSAIIIRQLEVAK